MKLARFRFHDELNFFLPRQQQGQTIVHAFDFRASIKDMIESLGVPHSEIELLIVNGTSTDFEHIVEDQDQVEVYPRFEAIEMADKVRLRPPFDKRPKFILDTHLGRLAAYLRMMGFDTLYRNDYPDDELAQVSHDENRILLTRDLGLLKRSLVIYGYFVRNTDPKKRISEIAQRFQLLDDVRPFHYCMKCNGLLAPVEKANILERLSPKTATHFEDFHQCQACEQIYWQGSHYEQMQDFMADIQNLAERP